jgi:hypothetical protein
MNSMDVGTARRRLVAGGAWIVFTLAMTAGLWADDKVSGDDHRRTQVILSATVGNTGPLSVPATSGNYRLR